MAATFLTAVAATLAGADPFRPGTTVQVSVSSSGERGDGWSARPAISHDGRYVAFLSSANNLVEDDTTFFTDVFVRDTEGGQTLRASLSYTGEQPNGGSSDTIAISGDGRYVAFSSNASNLVPGDTNGVDDVFVRDLVLGTTVRVSVGDHSQEAIGASWRGVREFPSGRLFMFGSYAPTLSADGRYVAFRSFAANLVPEDDNGEPDVFVHDVLSGSTILVSEALTGGPGDGYSGSPSISGDGQHVAFYSTAADLVPGDSNGSGDVFVRDVAGEQTIVASVRDDGGQANSASGHASISSDGRFVSFASWATNLVPGDGNRKVDVYRRDLGEGRTTLVSIGPNGQRMTTESYGSSISADGRFVAFESGDVFLAIPPEPLPRTPGLGLGFKMQIYLRDLLLGTTEVISVNPAGFEGEMGAHEPAIAADVPLVAFVSGSLTLVPGNANVLGGSDVYLRDPRAPCSVRCL